MIIKKEDLVEVTEEEKISLWDQLKKNGSDHYKTGGIEPIDLYREAGIFRHFAICSIIKYAFRNRNNENPVSMKDMDKIIDYAQKLKVACGE